MDYKYIEQLLDRYWECETTLEEEQILRSFFSQKDVPARLLPYQELFSFGSEFKEEMHLDDDFDNRLLEQVEQAPVRAKRISLWGRIRPLYKAVASVAIIITIGVATERAMVMSSGETPTIDYASYPNTYQKPAVVTATKNLDTKSQAEVVSTDTVLPSEGSVKLVEEKVE